MPRALSLSRKFLGTLLGLPTRGLRLAMPTSRRAIATTTRGIHDLVEQVLAAAAHEFKTPLAVVRAEAQLLQLRGGADVHLENITRQVDRLTHLVQQLLEVSRLRFGPPTLSLEVTDLRPVV